QQPIHQRRAGLCHAIRDHLQRLLWRQRSVILRLVVQRCELWLLLATARRRLWMGAVSAGPVGVDALRRLDVDFERAVGMGAIPLRALGIDAGLWLGLGAGLWQIHQQL